MRSRRHVGRALVLGLFALALSPEPRPGWSEDLPAQAAIGIGNIYNGEATRDFPAVVGIGLRNRDGSTAICSGTLIAPAVVLTAAHCLAFDPVAGIAAVFADGVTRRDYAAAAFLPHPQYRLARASVADVGIVLLETAVPDVAPLPLGRRSPRPGSAGTIVGYGQDNGGRAGGKRVGTVRLRRCPRVVRVRNGTVRLGKSLCWRPGSQGSDTCSGDSGGPLLVDGVVAGVTSGGIGTRSCPSTLSYDTNVARYRGWIESVVAQYAR
jgi:hypothetical protein